ncbi:MAG: hypothetical protein GY708_03340 [Actinomycetia bacterium]|nr:hypothetical protein [Actinomycetes bacterium]
MSEVVAELVVSIGGFDSLVELDDEPLGPFVLDPASLRKNCAVKVLQTKVMIETCTAHSLDDQLGSVLLQLLQRVANSDEAPRIFGSRPDRVAAAITWVALAGNRALGRGARWVAADVWNWYSVSNSTDLGLRVAEALGMRANDPERMPRERKVDEIELRDPLLLHPDARRWLIRRRRDVEEMVLREIDRIEENKSVIDNGDGTMSFKAMERAPLFALRAVGDGGRHLVMMGLGDDVETAACYAFNIPQARDLVRKLNAAINSRAFSSRKGSHD